MLPIRLSRAAVAALAVAVIACGDPTLPKATFTSQARTFTLYSLTGTPASVPNALLFLSGATRANSDFNFDIAFDIDAGGKAVVYPVRALASALAAPQKRVGLQTVGGTFESVREVPAAGYDTVKALTVGAGAVVAVEIRDQTSCFSSLRSQFLYAKLVVDSISTSTRRVFIRTVFDPNCGYRTVVPDSVPTI